IFSRRPQVERRLPEFPLTAPEGARRRVTPPVRTAAEHEPLQTLAERQLLDRYSPAYVVVNAEGEVLHGSTRTRKYLELAPGAPRMDIFSMARSGLRPDLRAGLHKAVSTGQIAIQKNVVVGTNGGRQTVDLVVHPVRTTSAQEMLYMVIFQDVGGIKTLAEFEVADTDEDLESA